MQKITKDLSRFQKRTSKHEYRWQAIAEEMTTFFNQPCYAIFHKYKQFLIEDAFRICKEKDIHNIGYLYAIIHNKSQ